MTDAAVGNLGRCIVPRNMLVTEQDQIDIAMQYSHQLIRIQELQSRFGMQPGVVMKKGQGHESQGVSETGHHRSRQEELLQRSELCTTYSSRCNTGTTAGNVGIRRRINTKQADFGRTIHDGIENGPF